MEECTKVKTITDFESFVKEVANLKEVSYVFRGEAEYEGFEKWRLVPRIFRNHGGNRYKEYELINAVINKFPSEFSSASNMLEILLKMQHYEIPTRLLDVTYNPYIALYFALSELEKKENQGIKKAYVYVINRDKLECKNIYSESLLYQSIIARLSREDRESFVNLAYQYYIAKVIIHKLYIQLILKQEVTLQSDAVEECYQDVYESFYKSLVEDQGKNDEETIYGKLKNYRDIQDIFNLCEFYISNLKEKASLNKEMIESSLIENCINETKNPKLHTQRIAILEGVLVDVTENKPIMNKMLNKIRYFTPGFNQKPNFIHYFQDYLIEGYSVNPRIINQQGGFILLNAFIEDNKLPEEYIEAIWEIDTSQLVENESIGKMLKHLDRMNINKNFIFPELQNFEHNRYLEKEK
ncbi:MAG: FRG domain-containing protein [Aerococcaceae bacterium]|nr:FRG domain-containing protein [Aerococcaceae bacterium]